MQIITRRQKENARQRARNFFDTLAAMQAIHLKEKDAKAIYRSYRELQAVAEDIIY